MKIRYIKGILFILVVLGVAFAAQFAGRHYLDGQPVKAGYTGVDIHRYLHENLDLVETQRTELAALEQQYDEERQRIEGTIREANAELAELLMNTEEYSPEVQRTIDKIHSAMGQLQKTTAMHLFELRAVLTEEQRMKFQKLITDALYENAGQEG